MDREPPFGSDRGDPFPTFDPEFSPPATRQRPTRSGGGPSRPPTAQPNPWLVGAAIAIVLATVSIIAFGLFGDTETAAGTTTTATPGDGTTVTTSDTTGPTTDITTDTSLVDGNTTVSIPTGGTGNTIPAVGSPIPLAELKLSSNDIGPLDFGDDGDEVLGRLVSTFGPPTDDTGFVTGSGSFGECPGESIRVVRWGPLNVVVRGEVGDSEFVSYRLDLKWGGISSPTVDLATVSGLRVGNKVSELRSIYSQFNLEFVVDQGVGGLVFQLRLNSNSEILLWGPVDSQADDALVTGIYSPDSCRSPSTTTTS